tara:strand:+ start:268 stop:564 length:297 start_codon:yes stop_codon:yes gene_type:complete
MPKKRKTKLKLPLNTGKPWSIGKILLYFFGLLLLLAWCTGGDDNGSGSKKSTVNKVYLTGDPVYYNRNFNAVLRHCQYENGEVMPVAAQLQCPQFLMR